MNANASMLPNISAGSSISQANLEWTQQQEQPKSLLKPRFPKTVTETGKRILGLHRQEPSVPDLKGLTSENQDLIQRAIETIRSEDSEDVTSTLEESRFMLRNSFADFQREQEQFRREFEEIRSRKNISIQRQKENAIPISLYLRQKRDPEMLADLRPNSSMNVTYQAYFTALLASDQNQDQHPTDKAAVIKYIRRRERRKRAEETHKCAKLSITTIERQTVELIQKMGSVGVQMEHERQRQNDLLQTKMNEKKIEKQNQMQVSGIIDRAHEANLARQRVEQKQREKIEERVTTARLRQNQVPTNMIHVQSRFDNDDDGGYFPLSDEQKSTTKNSIQLLINENYDDNAAFSATSTYDDENLRKKITDIHI